MDRLFRKPEEREMKQAVEVVNRLLTPTPLLASGLPNVFLKLETMQPTGSFKVRGALAAASAIPDDVGIVTASAGNHGLGMAYAADLLQRNTTVVVPVGASPAKVAKLKTYPIRLIHHGDGTGEAEQYALSLANDRLMYVSPYNDPYVVAGQSSLGFELQRQLPEPFDLACPVGGGGLCAGLALWAQQQGGVGIYGVEAQASQAVSNAIRAGKVISVAISKTLADGLAGQIEDPCITWEIMRDAHVRMTTVGESEIGQTMNWLFSHHGLVVEGSGAVALAAVLHGRIPVSRPLVVVLSGRNITASTYREVLA